MIWERKGKYYETSGRYSVSAARVGGAYRFTAWRGPGPEERIQRLVEGIKEKALPVSMGTFDSAAEARLVCERDAA